jgi:virginiamycin A acetyltransferase
MNPFIKLRLRHEYPRQMDSIWLRDYFIKKYEVDIGLYSYGCFDIRRVPKGTKIGRYCSFSQTCWFLNANHVLDYMSLHPFLYNSALGVVDSEPFARQKFIIGDDVWIGHNAVITASVSKIGRGAVIAAGAVVTKDVMPYEVVGGVPAKSMRFRFDAQTIERIEQTRWWLKSKEELSELIRDKSPMLFSPAQYFADTAAQGTAD